MTLRYLACMSKVALIILVVACASGPTPPTSPRAAQASARAMLLESKDIWPDATDIVVSTDEPRTLEQLAVASQLPAEARRRTLKESYSRTLRRGNRVVVSQATIWEQDREAVDHLADEYALRKQLFISEPTLLGGGDRDRPSKFGDESAAFFTKVTLGAAAVNSAIVLFRTGPVVHVVSVTDTFPNVVPPDAENLARKQLKKLNVTP